MPFRQTKEPTIHCLSYIWGIAQIDVEQQEHIWNDSYFSRKDHQKPGSPPILRYCTQLSMSWYTHRCIPTRKWSNSAHNHLEPTKIPNTTTKNAAHFVLPKHHLTVYTKKPSYKGAIYLNNLPMRWKWILQSSPRRSHSIGLKVIHSSVKKNS